MKDIIQSLAGYFEAVAGVIPQLKPAPDAFQGLPVYFGSLYEAWEGNFLDRHYLFLISKGEERSTPAEITGHHRVVTRELGRSVAFVFTGMESFERQRLVQHRVPFVVPRRQMYLPEFLIDLREGTVSPRQQGAGRIAHLSGASQSLLLYYLQKPHAPELCSLREWASLLGYSAMTATRIANELAETQLCIIETKGRKTILDFNHDRHALWQKALPFLRTPTLGYSHAQSTEKDPLPWLQSGLPALSHHTMLADDGHAVVAMSTAPYARALAEGRLKEVRYQDDDTIRVEKWRYRPEILSDGPTVDRLSLYLSLREEHDERVQSALKELLEGVRW